MNFRDLTKLQKKIKKPLPEVVLISQMMETGSDPQELRQKISNLLHTMLNICEKEYGKSHTTLTHLTGNNAYLLKRSTPIMMGEFSYIATVTALSIAESNASMGKIVACPTAGSCGVLPGMMYALRKVKRADYEDLLNSFIVAGAIGDSIAEVASISGAIAGCQAEIGTATAMASAAAVYVFSKDAEKCAHAAALSLKSLMGLVCDPVGGFVEVPCVKRNATAVNVAITTAEMAISGIKSTIPFDEVVESMAEVGRTLPKELRETGLGGVANSPTAQNILKEFGK